jgi:ADP-ribosylglycohydrolase
LGAGIASKEAAFSLAKASTQWHSNFFDTRRANYLNGGGNGAAMRVQPHVWAARDGSTFSKLLPDVIRNAICTHGHPRGILGAAFHALCLNFYLEERRPCSLTDLGSLALSLEAVWGLIEQDQDLSLFWVPQWASAHPGSLPEHLFLSVISEIVEDIEALVRASEHKTQTYDEVLSLLNLREPSQRGSATKTAIAAAWLAARHASEGGGAYGAIVEASNALGSDTDSIATMAGAMLGALEDAPPPQPVQDHEYIVAEAERLFEVRDGSSRSSFGYPDLRSYQAPRTAVDAILVSGDELVVSGLGRAATISDFLTENDPNGNLRWLRLEFGQTILARIRPEPKDASDVAGSLFEPPRPLPPPAAKVATSAERTTASPAGRGRPVGHGAIRRDQTLEEISNAIIRTDFSSEAIGQAILDVAATEGDEYLERAIGLAAIIAKAYRARRNRSR